MRCSIIPAVFVLGFANQKWRLIERMQNDTNLSLDELSDNHPFADVLSAQEKTLFLSALHDITAAAGNPSKNFKADVEFDVESPELTETTSQVGAALTICGLIKEVAKERNQSYSEDSDHTCGEK